LQWLQEPSQIKGDNLNNVRRENSINFKKKKSEYLEDKVNELATHSNNKNIRDIHRGISEFKKGYQPGTNLLKDENGDLFTDSHNSLSERKNCFSQPSDVHRASYKIELCTAEPLLPDPSLFEVKIVVTNVKIYTSLGIDQILAELIQAGGETVPSRIHKLINSIWNKEELPEPWKSLLLYQFTIRAIKLSVVNYRGISLLSTSYKMFLVLFVKVKSIWG
jgi:hypothetical protein